MDIAFDWNSPRSAKAGRGDGPAARKTAAPDASLDWAGLRARLSAAHAAQRALSDQPRDGDSASAGSFNCVSARALADYGASQPPVNPIFWADGKPARAKDAATAGETSTGGRGYK